LRNEYLAAENRILKAQLKTPVRLTDAERVTLTEITHHLGCKALEDVANVVKLDTLMGWYRRLVSRSLMGPSCLDIWVAPELTMKSKNVQKTHPHRDINARRNIGLTQIGGGGVEIDTESL